MSGPLNRQPTGLLAFFDLRSAGGRYPQSVIDAVQPTMDVERWFLNSAPLEYFSNANSLLNVDTNAGTATGGSNLSVPATEIWYINRIWSKAIFSAAAASTLYGLNNIILIPLAGSFLDLPVVSQGTGVQPFTNNAAIQSEVAVTNLQPFFAPPGSILAARHGGFDFGAATCTINTTVEMFRLKI